jgi:salicylate hydroxylase
MLVVYIGPRLVVIDAGPTQSLPRIRVEKIAMPHTRTLKILIAGGGIGGITALLALRQRGIEAELFEQAEAFTQVGAGIQVSCNATRILQRLGLGESLKRIAYYPEGRDYRAWDDGGRLYYTPLGRRAATAVGAAA